MRPSYAKLSANLPIGKGAAKLPEGADQSLEAVQRRRKERHDRNQLILRLSAEGVTHVEIAKMVGVLRPWVTKTINAHKTKRPLRRDKKIAMAPKDQRDAEMLMMRLAGYSFAQIGQRCGVTEQWAAVVVRELREDEVTPFQVAKRQRDAEILRLRAKGMPQCQIAERMGISRTWVCLTLKRLGVRTYRARTGAQ